jgi:hypothetical protein
MDESVSRDREGWIRPPARQARAFRRHIATETVKPGAGIAVLRDAVGRVMDARTDLAHIAA